MTVTVTVNPNPTLANTLYAHAAVHLDKPLNGFKVYRADQFIKVNLEGDEEPLVTSLGRMIADSFRQVFQGKVDGDYESRILSETAMQTIPVFRRLKKRYLWNKAHPRDGRGRFRRVALATA